jgi:ferredoxin-NADP reductase
MSETYATTYLGHGGCAPGVETFRFARPDGYTFRPGQFFQLTIATRDGEQTKHFTHADAPDDPAIEMTTRLTGSAFKDGLLALDVGVEVRIRGPMGNLAVPEGAESVGFLTGGVGITPAHSIIRDAKLRESALRFALFYANREPGCIPYADEFREYAARDSGFSYVEVVEVPDAEWTGPIGYLTPEIVRAGVDPREIDHWIVSGPPAMIEAMGKVVAALEIPPEAVSYERFAGY